jgi:pyridinium-3,5-bisthiocarboxylic acid mononucleotide nickel chelatase
MRILLIDPFHGAAGDMIIGALLSLIDEREMILQAMASVGIVPTIKTVQRCGITSLKVHTNAPKTHRTYEEVQAIIRTARVPSEVIERALKIFDRISRAEARVHGHGLIFESEPEENPHDHEHNSDHTHNNSHIFFHEVGADDAIADLIGSCMALYLLKPDRIIVLPVATGSGTVKIEHGIVPVPAPATAAILSESSLITLIGGREGELLTPTGAAILAEIVTDTSSDRNVENLTGAIVGVGYGAGTRDDPCSPNVIRMMLIEEKYGNIWNEASGWFNLSETNVENITGEIVDSLIKHILHEETKDK